MKIMDVIWRKPVSTYAISACEALVASVNSVNCTVLSYHRDGTRLVLVVLDYNNYTLRYGNAKS